MAKKALNDNRETKARTEYQAAVKECKSPGPGIHIPGHQKMCTSDT